MKSLDLLLNPLQLATSTPNHLLFVPLAAKSSLCLILVLRKLASSLLPLTVRNHSFLPFSYSLPPKIKAEGKVKAKAKAKAKATTAANGKRKNNAAQKSASKKAKLSKK